MQKKVTIFLTAELKSSIIPVNKIYYKQCYSMLNLYIFYYYFLPCINYLTRIIPKITEMLSGIYLKKNWICAIWKLVIHLSFYNVILK